MALTDEQLNKVNYLRASLRLQDPSIETDPALQFTDEELWQILEIVTPSHNREYTIDTLPSNEFNLVILLAKKEVYYRLATSTAPLYPLEAEGASLSKNVRFDHYMELIKEVEQDYKDSVERFINSDLGTVETYEQLAQGWHFTLRNYNQADRPKVELTVSNITSTSVNLDWTKFDISKGLFYCYAIYVSDKPIIDEYADNPFPQNLSADWFTYDIHKLKYRITGLKPDTDYYICVVSKDRTGLFGYSEKLIHTLPES